MITEKQVVQYLKNKDQDYIDNLLERIKNSCSINVESESKIICAVENDVNCAALGEMWLYSRNCWKILLLILIRLDILCGVYTGIL